MTISVDESRRLMAALNKAGARITHTERPSVRHDAWDAAYGDVAVPERSFCHHTVR